MNKAIWLVPLLGSLLFATQAVAACRCMCIDGEVRPICSSSIDLPPICAPRICPIKPPSVEPINPPRVPPIGTKKCTMKQVYNEYTQRYEWKQLCE